MSDEIWQPMSRLYDRQSQLMNAFSMSEPKSFQKLYPLSLFVRAAGQRFTGCLYVVEERITWSIYLEQGKLTFATNSDRPMERLARHLLEFSRQTPALTKTVQLQVQQQFTRESGTPLSHPDYHAIRWLVEQQYLNLPQATSLIETLARDVIEPFLNVTEGRFEFIQQQGIDGFNPLCQLELRPLVEACQMQLRRKQSALRSPVTASAIEESGDTSPILPPLPVSTQPVSAVAVEPAKEVYTIACIDDSSTILEAINSFLEEANFSVVMINDPLKALIQIIRTKPDVVLMDVGMPNLDGYELCSLLRRHSNFKTIPIIMVTGHTGFIDRAKAKLVGASGYLTKPFTRSELLKMVFKHLT